MQAGTSFAKARSDLRFDERSLRSKIPASRLISTNFSLIFLSLKSLKIFFFRILMFDERMGKEEAREEKTENLSEIRGSPFETKNKFCFILFLSEIFLNKQRKNVFHIIISELFL